MSISPSPDVSLGVAGHQGQPALAGIPGSPGAGPQLVIIQSERQGDRVNSAVNAGFIITDKKYTHSVVFFTF